LKGYGANLRAEERKKKEKLVVEIDRLDKVAEADNLDRKGWAKRMELEGDLVAVYKHEEL
jgi:hypothetical protein